MKENKEELKVIALKERIGTLVANYEEQLADLRADATMAVNDLNAQNQELQEEVENLREQQKNAVTPK